MVEHFVADFARLIASEPDQIEVTRENVDSDFSEITIYAHQQDVGKIIGKDGISYRILVKPLDERPK
jgi:predicted RNA-binding protein YlqC (UPF0109 family)